MSLPYARWPWINANFATGRSYQHPLRRSRKSIVAATIPFQYFAFECRLAHYSMRDWQIQNIIDAFLTVRIHLRRYELLIRKIAVITSSRRLGNYVLFLLCHEDFREEQIKNYCLMCVNQSNFYPLPEYLNITLDSFIFVKNLREKPAASKNHVTW